SSRRRHTRFKCDWSSDVCSSDLRRQTSSSLSLPHTPGATGRRQTSSSVSHTHTYTWSHRKNANFILSLVLSHTHPHTHTHTHTHTHSGACIFSTQAPDMRTELLAAVDLKKKSIVLQKFKKE